MATGRRRTRQAISHFLDQYTWDAAGLLRGHTIVSCVLVYRGVVVPYALSLWAPAAYCRSAPERGEPPLVFRKSTEIAAEMIASLKLPSEGKVIVMFDSFYLCPAVVGACKARGFAWISVAKKNRTFFPGGRDRNKRKLSS